MPTIIESGPTRGSTWLCWTPMCQTIMATTGKVSPFSAADEECRYVEAQPVIAETAALIPPAAGDLTEAAADRYRNRESET